jgi:FkbM family methyltransferase
VIYKQRIVSQLGTLSRGYLTDKEPRYLATFAHDGNSHIINAFGKPERWQWDTILAFLKANGLISGAAADIGANIGALTILLSQHYTRVFAFEPHPLTFRMLRFNAGNYAPNAIAIQAAIFSETKDLTLIEPKSQNIGAFSVGDREPKGDEIVVRADTLDNCPEVSGVRFGLLKVDTEGTEEHVFRGALGTLVRDKPVVVMEDFLSRGGEKSRAVIHLEQAGYNRFLEPAFYPRRRQLNGRRDVITKLRNALSVWVEGHAFGLRECDFQSPRGYDLLVGLHESHSIRTLAETPR